jgi:hypothetical protein
MIIAKRGKWQFVVKTCRQVRSVAVASSLFVGALFKKFGLFFEHAEIQENAIREQRVVTESAFQEAFQQWKKRWERCVVSRRDYFEGGSA